VSKKIIWLVVQKMKNEFILPLKPLKEQDFEHFIKFYAVNHRKVYK
jgi:hypothetical protein